MNREENQQPQTTQPLLLSLKEAQNHEKKHKTLYLAHGLGQRNHPPRKRMIPRQTTLFDDHSLASVTFFRRVFKLPETRRT